jgi:ribosomal subunit interface protein
MSIEVSFKGLKPRKEVRERAEALYQKLERFLEPASEARLMIAVSHGNAVLELVVTKKGHSFRAEAEDGDLRTALDRLFHTIEGQLRRSKDRSVGRRRGLKEEASDQDRTTEPA